MNKQATHCVVNSAHSARQICEYRKKHWNYKEHTVV